MKPYDHQAKLINETVIKLRQNKSVLIQASTGYGKTVVSAFLIKYYIDKGLRCVFVVDSEDLVKQTSEKFTKIGIINERITSRTKKPKHFCNCYIAMVETLNNRLEEDPLFLRNIDLIFSDEAHILVHQKIYSHLPKAKVIAMTATPVILKRETFFKCDYCGLEYDENTECCGSETMEWSKPFTFSQIYDDIVVSENIDWLIENDFLVKEIPFVKKIVDTSELKTDKTGDYTNTSQNHAFGNKKSIENLIENHQQLAEGKKTILFTPSTKINNLVRKAFDEKGIEAKSFDTRNNSKKQREPVLDWFRDTRDAILINTGCFVKGLNITDIECVVGYLSTNSLSKYMQYVGRAGRRTDLIYKDAFIHLDCGENINRHNLWSDPTRDWKRIFKHGLGKEKPKKEDVELVDFCDNCGALISKSENPCPHCDHEKKPKKKKEETPEGYKLVPITKLPPPNGKRIVKYTKRNNEGTAFAFRIMMNQICDLFRFYDVDKDAYENSIITGEFDKKIDKMIRKCYFEIIQSDLTGANRTLDNITKKTKEKIDNVFLILIFLILIFVELLFNNR